MLSLGPIELYKYAEMNSKPVGIRIAHFVTSLARSGWASIHELHIIGYSLGAHLAGQVGANLEGKLARITGLDPPSRYKRFTNVSKT